MPPAKGRVLADATGFRRTMQGQPFDQRIAVIRPVIRPCAAPCGLPLCATTALSRTKGPWELSGSACQAAFRLVLVKKRQARQAPLARRASAASHPGMAGAAWRDKRFCLLLPLLAKEGRPGGRNPGLQARTSCSFSAKLPCNCITPRLVIATQECVSLK